LKPAFIANPTRRFVANKDYDIVAIIDNINQEPDDAVTVAGGGSPRQPGGKPIPVLGMGKRGDDPSP
jgi:hypothetical protein